MTPPLAEPAPRGRSDIPFVVGLSVIGGLYILLIVGMLVADAAFTTPAAFWKTLSSPEIRASIRLSLITCSIAAILSVWVAVPLGYLLSRYNFPGKTFLDVLLDIPIVLPPLVIGLSLLILFETAPGQWVQKALGMRITYAVPAVIVAQFSVAAAFAVRTMRVTFDQISPRQEQVALTLGCSRSQAFWMVVLPQARRGMFTALTLAWARSLGEFGPILVFAGATRMHTEVLSSSVFLEFSTGDLKAAVAVSLIMVLAAVVVLLVLRVYGMEKSAPPA